jgi:AbrB family looped-hinge helix DNA binding protein
MTGETHYTSRMSTKGQMIIPATLRKKYGLKPGAQLSIGESDGKLVIQLDRYSALLALRGTLAAYPLEQDLMSDPMRARG